LQYPLHIEESILMFVHLDALLYFLAKWHRRVYNTRQFIWKTPTRAPRREFSMQNTAAALSEDTRALSSVETAKPKSNGAGLCRTTVALPLALNENWEAFALKSGVPKNEVLVVALKQYLTSQGLQPDLRPRLEVSY
jgi:hypothetical protein